jgi:5-methylthioribose kinase
MLTSERVVPYLRGRGLLEKSDTASARELTGGVSSTVLAVTTSTRRVVVKQALTTLRVQRPWHADPSRSLTEGRAMEVLARITPDRVPRLLDVDPDNYTLTMEHAPDGWATWKDQLLLGDVRTSVAADLGVTLAMWHRDTADDDTSGSFHRPTALEELRIDPYYRAVAGCHPGLAPTVLGVVESMLGRRQCLVHGDFSPKNILVGEDGVWVLDYEVAHQGDPTFDVAFMLNHLLLKGIARPQDELRYEAAARAFLDAYTSTVGVTFVNDLDLSLQLGCLLLARVDGKSPVPYLHEAQRDLARGVAVNALRIPPEHALDLWGRTRGARL